MSDDRNRDRRPHGGTPVPEMVEKDFELEPELEAMLRKDAFETDRSEGEVLRDLLRRHFENRR